jgi:hypothetical protein
MHPTAWMRRTDSIVAMLAEYPQRSTEALICLAPARLRLADGTEDWYQYASMNLRPPKESGSSSASGK